ncbi:MAG: RelA/SpoT [Halanaerobiales bacterium]|nr:RelA/SpoT [Halanaerobiales bacterium]
MADKEVIKKTISWYKDRKDLYNQLAQKVESVIKNILVEKDIVFHSIENRVKSIDSLKRKASKSKYKDPINEITDLAGIRIITLFEKDVYEISDIIKNLFKIDYPNSEDKSDLLAADKMGYKSVHYVAYFKENLLDKDEFNKFEGLKFEIQIRSILQHAWAEIEHDRNYKLKGNLPKHLQRRFYVLSGMLEMADREFNLLAKEVDEYKKKKNGIDENKQD